jgi:hypothetical protein
VGPHCEQEVQLLREQRVVVAEVVAEQRERLHERPASRHDLRASARQQVQRRELLEDPHGVVAAQHTHGAGQPDPGRALGARGQDHGRRGGGVVAAVVLADPEHVEAHLVGERDLLDDLAQPLRRPHAVGVQADVGEGVHPDLHAATVRRGTGRHRVIGA